MRRVQRITAGITSILVLQLSLLGTGTLCPSHRGTAPHGAHAPASMGSIHRVAGASSWVGYGETDSAASEGCDNGRRDNGCGGLLGSTTCASMSACSIAVSEPAPGTATLATATVTVGPLEPVAANIDLSVAPELPPPRA